MKKFLLASLNNTASYVSLLSFIAFLVLLCHGIAFYKHAFWIMVVALIIAFLTPNTKEYKKFFDTKSD